MMLRRRAKGAALDGDAHAIFTLNTMLAKQAAHKHHGASSVNLLAHSAGGEHGEIGVEMPTIVKEMERCSKMAVGGGPEASSSRESGGG